MEFILWICETVRLNGQDNLSQTSFCQRRIKYPGPSSIPGTGLCNRNCATLPRSRRRGGVRLARRAPPAQRWVQMRVLISGSMETGRRRRPRASKWHYFSWERPPGERSDSTYQQLEKLTLTPRHWRAHNQLRSPERRSAGCKCKLTCALHI